MIKRIALGSSGVVLLLASVAGSLSGLAGPSPGRLVATEASLVVGGSGSVEDWNSASYELINVGGSPLKILPPVSGCGCAEPVLSRSDLGPGEKAILRVDAQPIAVGEKRVSITVPTDSRATPSIALELRVLGSRRPPYLNRVVGDLTYNGKYDPHESRRVLVETIEPAGSDVAPTLQCDLPFLKWECVQRDQVENGFRQGIVHRARFYRM